MATRDVLCSDCPFCGLENAFGINTSDTDPKRPEIHIVTCRGCFRSYDVAYEDMAYRGKTEEEIGRMSPSVSTGSWVQR